MQRKQEKKKSNFRVPVRVTECVVEREGLGCWIPAVATVLGLQKCSEEPLPLRQHETHGCNGSSSNSLPRPRQPRNNSRSHWVGSALPQVYSCGRWSTPRLWHRSDVAAWCKSQIWRGSVRERRKHSECSPLTRGHLWVSYAIWNVCLISWGCGLGISFRQLGPQSQRPLLSKRWAADKRRKDGFSELLQRPHRPARTGLIQNRNTNESWNLRSAEMF